MFHMLSRLLHLARWRTRFRNLDIGAKINIGFAVLFLVLFLTVAMIFTAGSRATAIIDLTEDVRVPSALISAQAQASLLRMQAAVRGYLVLGDLQNIDDYNKAREDFRRNLVRLQALSTRWDNPEAVARLNRLTAIFEQWAPVSEQLFALHDNPLENRPALRLEDTQARPLAGAVLETLDGMIAEQEQLPPSAANRELLTHMLDFRTSFQAMTTNLRAYAITGDLAFKFGYADNLVANSTAFTALEANTHRMLPSQVAQLAEIRRLRNQFLELPEQIFAAAEGKHSYEDLYLFTTQVAPQAEEMLGLLTEITNEQQRLLQSDLNVGKQHLRLMQIQTLLGGLLSLALGAAMVYIFRRSISEPVQRLNAAALRVSGGDLDFQIPVESGDEIGRLAATFNHMTRRLRETIHNLERLYRLSQGIMAAQDLSQLVAEVVEGGSIPVINRAVLNIFDFNDQDQVAGMTVIANWYSGQGTEPSPLGTHYTRDDIPLIEMLRSRQPVFFNDLLNDPRVDAATRAVVERLHIRAMAVLPLWRQNEQIGVLILEGDEPYTFSEQEIRPYATLLVQLSVAIENRRLFEQIQQRAVELDRAKKAAEAANRAKSEFLARMSHELRTPLNAILGYAQILRRDHSLSSSQQHAVRVIQESGEHLLTLVADLLDISRIEARRLKLYPGDFHLPSFLESIVAIFRLRVEEKPEITLIYSPEPGLPEQIHADEKRLRQVLINLLENAFKFTEEGQVIFRVKAESEAEGSEGASGVPSASSRVRLRFEVEDTGIGMRAEDLERIFQPFEQAGEETLRAQGLGLGLAISRHLIQLMGGQLTVCSEPGRGSRFTVILDVPRSAETWESPALRTVEMEEVDAVPALTMASPREEDGPEKYRGLLQPAQIHTLLDLAWKGELPALSRYAQELARSAPGCTPLAERLQRLADAFDEEALLVLLERLAASEG